ncbi:MAG: hypothetical protein K2P92_01900, partial [Bdellovibrionaceae bacterium]|nr:hypothetical protein [Pseudobdellovibrionaceae bacterium]
MKKLQFTLLAILTAVFLVSFSALAKAEYGKHKYATPDEISKLDGGSTIEEIEELVNVHHAEALYQDAKLVGCVKKAHDVDPNLNAHVMFENLVVKASGVLAIKHLLHN